MSQQETATEQKYLELYEVPPTGSGKIQEINNSSRWCSFQYWLIKKIAGKRAIILNAHIEIIPRLDDRNILGRLTQTGKGMLLEGSYLWCDNKHMLLLANNKTK